MSVSSELYKVNVVGDGSTPSIAFNRKVFNSTDIKGFKYDTTTNVETALVNGTDFTVAGAGDAGNAQNTTLTTAGEFPAKSLEYAFDKLSIGTQEADGKADRAIKFPISDTGTSDVPVKATRKNKALSFDANGDVTVAEIETGINGISTGAALQTAIDAVINTGNTLQIPAGTITLTAAITITGSCDIVLHENCTITNAADAAFSQFIISAGDVKISGGTFDHAHTQTGSHDSYSPIRITGGNNVTITGCKFQNADYAGVAVAAASNMNRIRINDVNIENSYGGIFVQGNDYVVDGIHIQNPFIREVQTEAIDINSDASAVIIDNPVIRRHYIGTDFVLETGDAPYNSEAIDVEDCRQVIINNPMIDGAGDSFSEGTAQAGGASSITLKATSSSTDDFYNGLKIKITSGTGLGNAVATISDYNGTTKVATISSAWSVANPDSTSTYQIDGPNSGVGIRVKGRTTRNVNVNGGIIKNLARPVANTSLLDNDTSNWTFTHPSVSGAGSVITWTGAADADAQLTVTGKRVMVYVMRITVTGLTTGTLTVKYSGITGGTITSGLGNGDYMFYFQVGGTPDGLIELVGTGGWDGVIDIDDCHFHEYWGAGVELSNVEYPKVVGVTTEKTQHGVSILQLPALGNDLRNPIISDCHFMDFNFSGICQIKASFWDFLIANNHFFSNSKISDIEFSYAERGLVQGNILRGSPEIIHVRRGVGPIVIQGNHATSGSTSAVIKFGASVDADTYATDNHGWDHTWNGSHIVLPGSTPQHLWVDGTGDLRINSGKPTSDTDGTVVGTQT